MDARKPVLRLLAVLTLAIGTVAYASAGDSANSSYLLGVGDRIAVVVFGHDDLSGEYVVNSNGAISFPLIQSIKAVDLSIPELEYAIAGRLSPKFVKNPSVRISMSEYRPFFILGEVNRPGSYPCFPDTTVLKAVATAGGYTYRAGKDKIIVTRARSGEKVEVHDMTDALVLPGDVVEVPERYF